MRIFILTLQGNDGAYHLVKFTKQTHPKTLSSTYAHRSLFGHSTWGELIPRNHGEFSSRTRPLIGRKHPNAR